jgi:hypothetical protein
MSYDKLVTYVRFPFHLLTEIRDAEINWATVTVPASTTYCTYVD